MKTCIMDAHGSNLFTSTFKRGLKVRVDMNIIEILLKREKRLWNTTRQLNTPKKVPRVGGQLFLTLNSNFKNNTKSSKFPKSINFTKPFRETNYLQIHLKITKKLVG